MCLHSFCGYDCTKRPCGAKVVERAIRWRLIRSGARRKDYWSIPLPWPSKGSQVKLPLGGKDGF